MILDSLGNRTQPITDDEDERVSLPPAVSPGSLTTPIMAGQPTRIVAVPARHRRLQPRSGGMPMSGQTTRRTGSPETGTSVSASAAASPRTTGHPLTSAAPDGDWPVTRAGPAVSSRAVEGVEAGWGCGGAGGGGRGDRRCWCGRTDTRPASQNPRSAPAPLPRPYWPRAAERPALAGTLRAVDPAATSLTPAVERPGAEDARARIGRGASPHGCGSRPLCFRAWRGSAVLAPSCQAGTTPRAGVDAACYTSGV